MARPVGLALAVLLGAAQAAPAQVTINPGALEGLGSASPPRTRERVPPRPAKPNAPLPLPPMPPDTPPNARPGAPPSATAPTAPVAPSGKPPAKPALRTPPTAPPAAPSLAPAVPASPPPGPDAPAPVALPPARIAPPPPVPVAADAPGEAAAIPGGIRVTFGAGRSELNPATEAALRAFARGAKAGDAALNVQAYAGGGPEDPSTPRRLSLARALAARAVLISEGIPSTRIYVRALGAPGTVRGDGPADRVDLTAGPSTPP